MISDLAGYLARKVKKLSKNQKRDISKNQSFFCKKKLGAYVEGIRATCNFD